MATPAKSKIVRTIKKNFANPEETRPFIKGKAEVVKLGDITAMRATLEKGWRWSECVKPNAGTESCQVAHLGYVVTGHMTVRMDDGSEQRFGPGDVGLIPPGHDAWVEGNESVVFIDFQGGDLYAKPHP
jgi:hypothetical protein